MENMYCKIIAFVLFHLYFVFLYFCFQNFFSRNTLFSFAFVYFCLQKAHYFFSILSFLFAKLYFLLQYFNYLANIYMALFWLHTDKAAFVSAVLLCVQHYRGNRYFSAEHILSVCSATHLKMFRQKETPISYAAIILITEMWQNISGENFRLYNSKIISIFGLT